MSPETIAESTNRPLLIFPTGELGNKLSDIQNELRRLVRYATAWKAVLLIDEADVFLETRESGGQTSLERNALVAGMSHLTSPRFHIHRETDRPETRS